MNRIKIILLIFLVTVIISSCRKDKPELPKPKQTSTADAEKGGVFIINEGNFQYGNASLSFYSFNDSTIKNELFKSANGRALGDVFQSMEIINGKAFLVINNSGKIEIINPSDQKSIATISGFVSPRFIKSVYPGKAYVTDFASNTVSVVDLNSNSIIRQIPCRGWTEELIVTNNKVFITNMYSEYVYVINPQTDQLTDSIKTSYASNSIRKDRDGKLWILCSGDLGKNESAALHKVNPVDNIVEATFAFPANKNPFKLRINKSGNRLYFIDNGVYSFRIEQSNFDTQPLISSNGSNWWGLGIEPYTETIFVGDAMDYVQKGRVLMFKSDGTPAGSLNTGTIPGDFCFYR